MKSRRFRNKEPEYFPSLAEVKQDEKWPIFEEILSRNDEASQVKKVREELINHVVAQTGIKESEVRFISPSQYVSDFFKTFCAIYSDTSSRHLDELREMERVRNFLEDIEVDLYSEAEKRHAMLDELRAAGATWPQIAALVTENWDDLEEEGDKQYARMKETEWLTNNHINYRKKNRAYATIVSTKQPTKKSRGTK